MLKKKSNYWDMLSFGRFLRGSTTKKISDDIFILCSQNYLECSLSISKINEMFSLTASTSAAETKEKWSSRFIWLKNKSVYTYNVYESFVIRIEAYLCAHDSKLPFKMIWLHHMYNKIVDLQVF